MYIYRVLARNYHRKKKLKGYRGGVYGIHTSSASEKKNSQLIKIWNLKKRNGAFCAVQVWGKISCM